jgi:hypothetical protein
MSKAPTRAASRRGRTLKHYLVDSSPSGVITAELSISSVRAAVALRTALPDLIQREETSRTDIYLSNETAPDLPGRQIVYVGESDKVKARLPTEDGESLRFDKDVPFDSPSGARSVSFGDNVIRCEFWRHVATGQRCGDWRASLIYGGAA